MNLHKFVAIAALSLGGLVPLAASADMPGDHPAYIHALSDLRAARWLIQHRPSDWVQTMDEQRAVGEIDAAIRDLKEAAYDDGKDLEYHPQVDERRDQPGRLHEALDILKRAHADVAREEDNAYARGLRNRSLQHMDVAIHAIRRAIHDE